MILALNVLYDVQYTPLFQGVFSLKSFLSNDNTFLYHLGHSCNGRKGVMEPGVTPFRSKSHYQFLEKYIYLLYYYMGKMLILKYLGFAEQKFYNNTLSTHFLGFGGFLIVAVLLLISWGLGFGLCLIVMKRQPIII